MPTYPYTSGQSAVIQAFAQLRKSFPTKVDSSYLKRFAIAPANESYILGILRFIGLIDGEEGARRDENVEFFFAADDEAFEKGLENRIREAYATLFEEMGDDALTAERANLIHWFRASDKTSDLVGQRQAATFQTLAALAGHGDVPNVRAGKPKKSKNSDAVSAKKQTKQAAASHASRRTATKDTDGGGGESAGKANLKGSEVGLTVRIEVNLPAGGDGKTYDAIFASIKKHLMS